jgi:hypothetical protein
MKDLKPLRRGTGDQHLHRESNKYRDGVKRKMHAYHVFIQAGSRVGPRNFTSSLSQIRT